MEVILSCSLLNIDGMEQQDMLVSLWAPATERVLALIAIGSGELYCPAGL